MAWPGGTFGTEPGERGVGLQRQITPKWCVWPLAGGLLLMLTVPVQACTERPIRIEGTSMVPLLAHGQSVPVEIGDDCAFTPARGEIVLVRNYRSRIPLIKRVYAIPGDTFALEGETLLVNGTALRNSAGQLYHFAPARQKMLGLYIKDYNGMIPPHTYLLLGEAARGSLDSSNYGLVDRADIIGRTRAPAPAPRPESPARLRVTLP